jgi:hypothetical protein
MTKRVPDHKRKYQWHTIRCKHCGRRHETERPNTKFCSEACSKAYRRDLADRREEAAMVQEAATGDAARDSRMPGQATVSSDRGIRIPDARTASSEIEAESQSQGVDFQADQLLLIAADGAKETWRLTRAADERAYEIQRCKRNGWITMLRAASGREVEKGLHQLTLDGHDFAWGIEDVLEFIDDNPLIPVPVRQPDDGIRFIDGYGFIHRANPTGTRSQLPGRYN